MFHDVTIRSWSRSLALTMSLVVAIAGSGLVSAAQDESEEMFSLGIVAVNCDIQAPTNITVQEEGCRPAEGVVFTVSVDMENGEGIGSCTAKVADVPNPITAGCSIPIPFGASVSVNQDPSTVPGGYEIVQNAQKFTAPESPESGEAGGVIFVNLLQTDEGDGDEGTGEVEEEASEDGDSSVVVEGLPSTGAGSIDSSNSTHLAALLVLAVTALVGSASLKTRAK